MALDKTDLGIAAGGVVAFLLGFRRLAGAVWGIGGLYEIGRNKKVGGGVALAGGTAFLLFPDWPEGLVGALKDKSTGAALPPKAPAKLPPPTPISITPFQRASFPVLDRTLNGWVMLDVRDIRAPAISQRAANLQPGDVVSLVLQYQNGPYMVFNVRVISGPKYSGQWMTEPPAAGPQFAQFGPEHVFVVR